MSNLYYESVPNPTGRGTKWRIETDKGDVFYLDSQDEAMFVKVCRIGWMLPKDWLGIEHVTVLGIEHEPQRFTILQEMEYLGHKYSAMTYLVDFKLWTSIGTVWVEVKGFNRFRKESDERFKEHVFIERYVKPEKDTYYVKVQWNKREQRFGNDKDNNEQNKQMRKEKRTLIADLWKKVSDLSKGNTVDMSDFLEQLHTVSRFKGAAKKLKEVMIDNKELIMKAAAGHMDAIIKLQGVVANPVPKPRKGKSNGKV